MMRLVLNSFGMALGATAVAVFAGFAAGLYALAALPRQRTWVLVAAAMTLALPPFLVANCWLELTSEWRTGMSGEASAVWMLPIAAGVMGSMFWPIPFFLLLGRWQVLQPAHIELEGELHGWNLIRHVLVPVAKPALQQSILLTTTLALSNFTIPTLFQVRVFTEEFWIRYNTRGDILEALNSTWPIFLLPAFMIRWFRPKECSWPRMNSRFPSTLFRHRLGKWHLLALGVTVLLSILGLGLPLWILASNSRTWSELGGAWMANGPAIKSTLLTSLGTAFPMAVLVLVSSRLPVHRHSLQISKFAWLPFLMPGIATGLAMLWIFNRPSLSPIYQSSAILMIAFGIRYLGPLAAAFSIARQSLDQTQELQSRLDGIPFWARMRHGIWPQAGPTACSGAYIVFLLCLWDVETAVLIQPPGGQTLALRIFNFLHYGHSTQVNALCIIVLCIAILPILGWKWLPFSPGPAINRAADSL